MALIDKLTAIGDGFRSSRGVEDKFTLDQMATMAAEKTGGFPNGTEWTQSNVNNISVSSITYNRGLWVAACQTNGIYYSEDGKTWSQSNITDGYYYNDIVYANGIWTTCSTSSGPVYSEDGITWQSSDVSNIDNSNDIRIGYGNGIWAGINGSHTFYSEDGITWIQNESSEIVGGQYYKAPVYADGIWVLLAINTIYYSEDGKTWTGTNVSLGNIYRPACYADGIWVVINSGGSYYSEDGKNWNAITLPDNAEINCEVSYANGLWLAGDINGVYYSEDGQNWIKNEEFINPKGIKYMHNACGVWIAAGGDYCSKGILYSVNGINWSETNVTNTILSLCNANGIWVAGTQDTGFYYSVTWEPTA